jgi:hypothetical protein
MMAIGDSIAFGSAGHARQRFRRWKALNRRPALGCARASHGTSGVLILKEGMSGRDGAPDRWR